MALELIEIKDFPRTTSVTGSGDELIVVSKADGKTYGIKTSDFKAFLGTVQSIAPKPIAPTDPAPTLDGVYIPTVTQNEAGTPIVYTNAGGLTVNTAEGGEDYGNKVELIRNGAVWVKSTYPLPIQDVSNLISDNQLNERSNNLFKINDLELFPDANLTVRRYQSNETFNDYPAGYSQTPSSEGLKISVPASGSTAIKHYFRTGKYLNNGELTASFKWPEPVAGLGAAIGYIDGNGDYVYYHLSGAGVFRKYVNFTSTTITIGLQTYGEGDVVDYIVSAGSIVIKVNGSTVTSYTLEESEFKTELLIGQAGFIPYTVNFNFVSDPIREYVRDQVTKIDSLPKCFYDYNPTGVVNSGGGPNTGLFTIYVNIGSNYYSGFRVGHEVDMRELQWKDYWRIRNAAVYEYNGSQMMDTGLITIASGESECVWKRNSNKDDFTGGTHGDEIVQEVLFFANGVNIASWTREAAGASSTSFPSMPLTPCDSFYYLEKSTMHETAEKDLIPIPGHPIECYHTKKTDFDNKGYTTFNELTWVKPGLVTLWYHGISCLATDFGSWLYSQDFVQRDMEGETEGFPETVGYRDVWFRNPENKGSAFITSRILKVISGSNDVTEAKDKSAVLFVSDRNVDSKYYRRMSPTNVLEGDVWQSEMEVRFEILSN